MRLELVKKETLVELVEGTYSILSLTKSAIEGLNLSLGTVSVCFLDKVAGTKEASLILPLASVAHEVDELRGKGVKFEEVARRLMRGPRQLALGLEKHFHSTIKGGVDDAILAISAREGQIGHETLKKIDEVWRVCVNRRLQARSVPKPNVVVLWEHTLREEEGEWGWKGMEGEKLFVGERYDPRMASMFENFAASLVKLETTGGSGQSVNLTITGIGEEGRVKTRTFEGVALEDGMGTVLSEEHRWVAITGVGVEGDLEEEEVVLTLKNVVEYNNVEG